MTLTLLAYHGSLLQVACVETDQRWDITLHPDTGHIDFPATFSWEGKKIIAGFVTGQANKTAKKTLLKLGPQHSKTKRQQLLQKSRHQSAIAERFLHRYSEFWLGP